MATKQQLLQQLKSRSYTAGWGAIAVFDGTRIAQRLADHYSLMVHGSAALTPIEAPHIRTSEDGSSFASLTGMVLEAPRISFISNSLQDSRMLVSFALTKGIYTEHSLSVGQAERVTRIINASVGRTYQFTFEVDLAQQEGTVDPYGAVKLTLGTGQNPHCELGSFDVARRKLGEFLLEQINLRYASHASVELPLGWIETERGHTLPKSFVLRTQAKPDSASGEGAVVLFIAHPDGTRGGVPDDAAFPYFIPDDPGSDYSATVLVAPTYPKLREGEAERLFGQLLFPNEKYFSVVDRHTDTVDEVVFGRFSKAASAPDAPDAPDAPRAQRHTPGVTAQVITREVRSPAVTIQASSDATQVWTWQLETPGLGTLVPNGASATYTPPAALAAGEKVAIQRVLATHTPSGAYHEVCIILQAEANRIEIYPPLVKNFAPNAALLLEANDDIYAGHPEFRKRWTVIGAGTVAEDGFYVSPENPTADIEVVVYECWIEMGTSVTPIGFGYCIVQFDMSTKSAHWENLTLKLKTASTGARPYANGLQQLEIAVTWDTGENGKPLLPEELATLRLVFKDGREVPFLPTTVEGLTPPPSGSNDPVPAWAFSTKRNRFNLARGTNAHGLAAAPNDTRTVPLYLHTLAESPAVFAVRLTDIYNREHTSNVTGGEQDERELTVEPRAVPQYSSYQYDTTNKRVEGGYQSNDPSDQYWKPDNPNNAWNFTSVDYWHYQLLFDQQRIRFLRLQWEEDGPGVRWESPYPKEDAFSYLGYMLVGVERESAPQTHLRYASELYNSVLYDSPDFTDEVPGSRVIDAEKGDTGTLLISLHRVLEVFYRQKSLIPGFNLERTFIAVLWDENGTRHRNSFGFEADKRERVVRNSQPI
ncbi:MAG: hypothetical protein ACRYF9_14990 [Janthinobacterium lividum]